MNEPWHDPETGLVDCAEYMASPNCDARPDDTTVNVIVIHAICLPPQTYGNHYVEDFFTNQLDPAAHPYFEHMVDRRVSSHFYIRRAGHLIQFVSTFQRAWHAGESHFMGRDQVNDFSIGIELEGCDAHQYESEQYHTLSALVSCLRAAYPGIVPGNIAGHADISPLRKTDPGPCFDWNRFLATQQD